MTLKDLLEQIAAIDENELSFFRDNPNLLEFIKSAKQISKSKQDTELLEKSLELFSSFRAASEYASLLAKNELTVEKLRSVVSFTDRDARYCDVKLMYRGPGINLSTTMSGINYLDEENLTAKEPFLLPLNNGKDNLCGIVITIANQSFPLYVGKEVTEYDAQFASYGLREATRLSGKPSRVVRLTVGGTPLYIPYESNMILFSNQEQLRRFAREIREMYKNQHKKF